MSDLIDRQAAIDAVSYECGELRGVFGRIEERLKALPSAQTEIIECGDCEWWKLSEYNTCGIHICNKFSGVRGEHDFCSRGERRTNE